MAMIHLESFENISTVNEKYVISSDSYVIIDTVVPRTGSQGLRVRAAAYGYRWFPGGVAVTGVIGFSYRNHSTGRIDDTFHDLLRFYGDDYEQGKLGTTINGYLIYIPYLGSTYISEKALISGKRYYIEVKWNCVNSIGADTFIVLVNGEEWLNLPAGTDTRHTGETEGVSRILLCGSGSYVYFDDVYICDLTGGVNDDFLGDVAIVCLNPDGNGNTNDFTGSDADSTDNYLHVDETQPDDDASYVESSVVTDVDLYTFENLAVTPTVICAVQTVTFAKKDDASAKTAKLITRINSTNYEGSAFAPDDGSYAYFTELWDVNPDDSAAWEEADLNGAEFGIKVES